VQQHRNIEVSGATLECALCGSGPPVVLLANAGCSTGYFDELAHVLAAGGLQAISINMRGTGESRGSLDGITVHDLAADVAGVLEALDCGPAHLAPGVEGGLPRGAGCAGPRHRVERHRPGAAQAARGRDRAADRTGWVGTGLVTGAARPAIPRGRACRRGVLDPSQVHPLSSWSGRHPSRRRLFNSGAISEA
jgi:hypothetical protein